MTRSQKAKLGKALMDISMTMAIPASIADYKWVGIVMLCIGGIGRLLFGLYSDDHGAKS